MQPHYNCLLLILYLVFFAFSLYILSTVFFYTCIFRLYFVSSFIVNLFTARNSLRFYNVTLCNYSCFIIPIQNVKAINLWRMLTDRSPTQRSLQNVTLQSVLAGFVFKETQALKWLRHAHRCRGVTLTHRAGWTVNILQWLMVKSPGRSAFTGVHIAVTGLQILKCETAALITSTTSVVHPFVLFDIVALTKLSYQSLFLMFMLS